MSIQSLKDKLTIVIPSKNEGSTLYECIYNISKQNNISGVRIIIADISNEHTSLNYIKKIETDFKYSLNIDIIKGGYPAEGRLYGSLLVRTKYMLFLDADIMLCNPDIINETIKHEKDLTTVPLYTVYPYRWTFRVFDLFQKISTALGTPFAIGGYQLWNTDAYWNIGGYNPRELFAEDYSISKKVDPKNFMVAKVKGSYTSPRRFENKGVLWMFMIMVKAHINRNNPEFFLKSHGYWN